MQEAEEFLRENERLRAQLREQERLLTHFLGRANHDLKGPARRIHMLSSLLQDESIPADERRDVLAMLVGAAENLREMVDGFSALHRARSRRLDVRPESSLQDCALAALQGRGLSVVGIEELPELAVDEEAMIDLFAQLIDNAVQWSGRGEELQLSFSAQARDGGWVIGLQDNGEELFDAERRALAVLPFERLTGDGPEHVGLGLSVAVTLADRIGGRLWVEAGPGFPVRAWFPIQNDS